MYAALLITVCGLLIFFGFLHWLSYHYVKWLIVRSRKWGLNIACGYSDGGGVNADIVQHAQVPNFVKIDDIYHLPFTDKQFDSVLCSHTIEHVDDPHALFTELSRVGREVVFITPPIWDLFAALNFREHKWIVLSWRKRHYTMPRMIKFLPGWYYQQWFGQVIKG
jgi:SAM-dependent methyltransferase